MHIQLFSVPYDSGHYDARMGHGPLHLLERGVVPALVGADPLPIEALRHKLLGAAGFSGPGGIFALALAAIDSALWDLAGKAANLPLATLLGGARQRVPTYTSGALGRDLPLDVLAQTAAQLVQRGFRQVKLQLGGAATQEAEVERVRVVREAVGPEVTVLADVNQRWSVKQALAVGQQLAPFQRRSSTGCSGGRRAPRSAMRCGTSNGSISTRCSCAIAGTRCARR